MKAARSGRYQSGREVFEKYIPGYVERPCGDAASDFAEVNGVSTAKFVNELLEQFSLSVRGETRATEQHAPPA
ncbi:hypothetical protein [Maioricimonas sp. JC845]|uniref:hypothetical protein n=1 Tax=Maioricimonas sp. JC845 TaxID=3232138 RepID=UPI003458A13F